MSIALKHGAGSHATIGMFFAHFNLQITQPHSRRTTMTALTARELPTKAEAETTADVLKQKKSAKVADKRDQQQTGAKKPKSHLWVQLFSNTKEY